MQTICTLLQTDNSDNDSLHNVHGPDALSGAQPTVSKHRRQSDVDLLFVNTNFKLQQQQQPFNSSL